jgi:serine/threonine-protein kinase
MGTVYKGYDRTLNRHVALKVLPREVLNDDSFAERFRREAQIWGRLDHASIVPVYFADIEEEHPFLAMKFIAGGSLAELLKKGPLTLDRATAVLAEIASALDYAHALGIVHRDVKPANVLLGEGHRAYLSDFGIARVVVSAASPIHTGVVGTPSYMAPEQARSQQADPRSDLYSLGCMAYEMLTGLPPFRGETPIDVMMRHITETPTSPRALAPTLPHHAEAAILKAMAKDPGERWPRAILFVQALLGEVRAEGVQTVSLHGHTPLPEVRTADPTTLPAVDSGPDTGSRHRRLLLAFGLGALVMAALGAGVVWGGRGLRNVPAPLASASPEDERLRQLLRSVRHAMDEGNYPGAIEMAKLTHDLYPEVVEAEILREGAQRAWEAEQSLGVWTPPPSAPGEASNP